MFKCNGEWQEIIVRLYAIFNQDFRQSSPKFRGLPIWWDQKVEPGQLYEDGFWHLIAREDLLAGERLPDFRRAERLPWCRPLIDHERELGVLVWDYDKGGGKIHTYIWLQDLDYVVVP